jgi:hypothetical protein
MANAMLTVAQALSLEMDKFGDSTAAMDLNQVQSTTLWGTGRSTTGPPSRLVHNINSAVVPVQPV